MAKAGAAHDDTAAHSTMQAVGTGSVMRDTAKLGKHMAGGARRDKHILGGRRGRVGSIRPVVTGLMLGLRDPVSGGMIVDNLRLDLVSAMSGGRMALSGGGMKVMRGGGLRGGVMRLRHGLNDGSRRRGGGRRGEGVLRMRGLLLGLLRRAVCDLWLGRERVG